MTLDLTLMTLMTFGNCFLGMTPKAKNTKEK